MKTLLSVITMTVMAGSAMAQGAYVDVNLGFGAGCGSQNMPGFYNSTESANSLNLEQINLSFGKGLNFGAAVGYMFNQHIGAELGLSYLIGGKTTAKEIDFPKGTTETTLSAKMMRINPTMVYNAAFDGLSPYAKFGLVIGSGSITSEEVGNDGTDSYTENWKYDGGLAMGMSAALGATLKLSDNMSFFGELNMVNMSYAPTKGSMTEAIYNGTNVLALIDVEDKEIEFEDSVTYTGNEASTSPSKALKMLMPFGSVGVNVGVKMTF